MGGTVAAVLSGLAVITGNAGEFVLRGGRLLLLGPVAAHVCGRPLILLVDADQRLGVLRRGLVRG